MVLAHSQHFSDFKHKTLTGMYNFWLMKTERLASNFPATTVL